MKNKVKKAITFIAAIVLAVCLTAKVEAKPVDKAAATSLATRLLNKAVVDATPSQFTGCLLFTDADGKGFALIAADDCVRPVLAYSPDGSWYRFSESSSGWDIYHPIDGYYTWLIRAVLTNTTGIEESAYENTDFAFISDGELFVLGEGYLQVFDLLGRQLFAKQVSTPHSSLLTSPLGYMCCG